MGLELIVGPPNSGREGELLRRLEEMRGREPVLVVPTLDDATHFERELCDRGGGAVLGVTIATFASLFELAGRTAGLAFAPPLTPPQRLALIRAAIGATELRRLRRSSARPGFAPALDALVRELQSALVAPSELAATARELEDGEHEHELAGLYEAYLRLRDDAGRSDAGSRAQSAIAALRDRPEAWAARPVLLYGFDDLTRSQLELLAALGLDAELVVAVNYADRDALAARSRLFVQLRDELGGTVARTLAHDPTHTERATLRHLDAGLFEPQAGTVELDGGVSLLECAGELGEAEALGAEVARLLADGVAPDAIAIVLRDPNRRGPLLERVFERLEIPVAVEAEVPLAATAVGRSLIALCRAVEGDDPSQLLAHLRSDPSTPPSLTDSLELRLRRARPATLDAALEGWRSPPRHLAKLRPGLRGGTAMLALAEIARELAQAPHGGRAPLAGRAASAAETIPFDAVEQRAAVSAGELLAELAEAGELPGCDPPSLGDAAEALESATVRLWRGPAEGRVRVLDPYGVRAARVRHLFCAGLQEGDFPRRSPGDPLLSDERRRRLGIEPLVRRDPFEEERYLFHACISRPTERLHLSWQGADDDGAPAARSPFIDEVLDLLGPDPETTAGALLRRRGLDRVTFAPEEAPTERELARALALAGPRVDEIRPRHLHVQAVLDELARRDTLSASTLERWLECPYRWFVEHELKPERLDPESDALRLGSVAHDALEALYRDPPGADSIPRPGDLDRWRRRLGELVEEVAPRHGLRPDLPGDAIALARLRRQIERFLEEESTLETELRPRPDLLEVGFGMDEEGEGPAALELGGGARLRGRIDRIDLSPDGDGALVRDYKTSRQVHGRAGWKGRGKLQLQLYVLAARERIGLEPIGGLYSALGARKERKPRGMVLKDDPRLGELDLVGGDPCAAEDFEEELERARSQAAEQAGAMRAGLIDRDPIGGRCPTYCTFQPICRLERAVGLEESDGESGGEGG